MDTSSLRYIVFLIDSQIKEHDGKIFRSHELAKDYVRAAVADHYADKAVIGMFYLDSSAEEMQLTLVETIGFKGDKRDVMQLELFTALTK